MSDLEAQAQRRETETVKGTYQRGIRVDKRTKHLVDEGNHTYNTSRLVDITPRPGEDDGNGMPNPKGIFYVTTELGKRGLPRWEHAEPTERIEDRRRQSVEERDAVFTGTDVHRERFLKKYGFDETYNTIVRQLNADAKRKPGEPEVVNQATIDWIN